MPLLTLHLLRCAPGTSARTLLADVRASTGIKVIVAAQPQYTVIAPQRAEERARLLQPAEGQWDLMVLVQSASSAATAVLPESLRPLIAAEYRVPCGVPSRLLASYDERNAALRATPPPPATGSLEALRTATDTANNDGLPTGERLEVSQDLLAFMEAFERRHGSHVPMTMLNLLCFNQGGKESYAEYGRAFVDVAGRRGGDAKLVGNVAASPSPSAPSRSTETANNAPQTQQAWHEVSIVHYPSIRSFCDMLAGKDYQEINEKYRLNALQDTFLLCTTETFETDSRGPSKL